MNEPACEICGFPAKVIIEQPAPRRPIALCKYHNTADHGGYEPVEMLGGQRTWVKVGIRLAGDPPSGLTYRQYDPDFPY